MTLWTKLSKRLMKSHKIIMTRLHSSTIIEVDPALGLRLNEDNVQAVEDLTIEYIEKIRQVLDLDPKTGNSIF